ncbi:NAD(P)/FAD-dependent oxidoreductase [bacterium]|nr:NAD(P)/FAD-dependent oxidoreductase [bacterium]
MDFDYGIVGGGPAGYTAAIMLAQQGKTVILFEKDKLGGTCLNKGCIPTKSLLHASEFFKSLTTQNPYGLNIEIKDFDFTSVLQKKETTVEKIRKSLELAVKNAGVNIIYSEAKIIDKNTITANNNTYNVDTVICATGSRPKEIKGLEFDHKFILSSDDVLELKNLPQKVLIIGSGAIGIEWTRIFSNFGCEVHISEIADHLIPIADIEVSKRIERIFKQNKIKFYLKDSVEKIENKTVTIKSGQTITPDIILVAAGRTPLTANLDCKIIGDASNEIQLAHYAIHQAKKLSTNIDFDKSLIPSVIYGSPEIAWVGLREQDCDETYNKVLLPITALGKAWCDDATEGFIKIIEKDRMIKGAHIVSKEASSLIQQIVIAMQNNITIDKLKEVCFAHPTYSEGIFEAICRI